ncbi:MAG TPA: FHA domain-containing protein [Polyangia bacterium]|jgi:hypothetical protein|nr:FHA domain-containing protein [Polyangia bacterium]
MAVHPSNKDGAGGDKASQPNSGLDAELDRSVPSGEPEAFLLGVGGAHAGRGYPLIHNTIYLGRAVDADISLPDASVSARHARLINGSQGFELEDLGSSNGTFVDGRRVSRVRLRSGDRIALGQVEFKFLVERRIDATMMILPAGIPTVVRSNTLARYTPAPVRISAAGTALATARRNEDDGPSLEEIFGRAAKTYKFLEQNAFLLRLLAGMGALLGLMSVFVLPPRREAACVMKLQPQAKVNPFDSRPSWSRPPSSDDQEVLFADAETGFVQPDLVAETLKKVLGRTPTDGAVKALAERLRMEAKPDNVYKATYRETLIAPLSLNPVEILRTHLENYKQSETARAIRVFTAQAEFLREQLKVAEGDMKKISDEQMQFLQKNSDRLPEGEKPMLDSRFALETRRSDLVAQVRRLQAEVDAQRRAQVDAPLPVGGASPESAPAAQRFHSSPIYRDSLANLDRKLDEARARGLAEGHPEVLELKEEKRRLEGPLLESQLAAARSSLADTEQKLGRVSSMVGDLPRVQAGVQRLTHMQEATTQLHGQLFEQLKKAELQFNLERVSTESRYQIVSPAQIVKVGPVMTGVVRVAAGLFLGLFMALGLAVAKGGRRMFTQALSNLNATRTISRH